MTETKWNEVKEFIENGIKYFKETPEDQTFMDMNRFSSNDFKAKKEAFEKVLSYMNELE